MFCLVCVFVRSVPERKSTFHKVKETVQGAIVPSSKYCHFTALGIFCQGALSFHSINRRGLGWTLPSSSYLLPSMFLSSSPFLPLLGLYIFSNSLLSKDNLDFLILLPPPSQCKCVPPLVYTVLEMELRASRTPGKHYISY